MSIYALKSGLAKLLATENITMRHVPGIPTAYFDLKSRSLNLPVWQGISNDLYDLLIGHETGHARLTDTQAWAKAIVSISEANYTDPVVAKKAQKAVAMFLNVVEDARIDRLQKIKYPGLKVNYQNGYKELLEDRDFFHLKNRDVNSLSFIDRANVYFKGGDSIGIKFNDAEKQFIERMSKTQTMDDVIALTEEIFKFAKNKDELPEDEQECPDDEKQGKTKAQGEKTEDNSKNAKSKSKSEGSEQEEEQDGQGGDSEEDESEDEDQDGSGSGDESDDDQEESDGSSGSEGDGDSDEDNEGDEDAQGGKAKSSDKSSKPDYEVKEGKQPSNGLQGGEGPGSANFIPVVETEIAAEEEMRKITKSTGNEAFHYINLPEYDLTNLVVDYKKVLEAANKVKDNDAKEPYGRRWANVSARLKQIQNEEKDNIIYMVKEFERRKSAQIYARQSIAKTGVIDTNKLHGYSYREDIFRRLTTVPQGKNHGFVMFLDWSSSMSGFLEQTLIQLYSIVWFCKRVQIPFEVYIFRNTNYNDKAIKGQINSMENDVILTNNFVLRNVLSSRMKPMDLTLGMEYLLSRPMGVSNEYDPLTGTPLNHAILVADKVINQFRQKNKVEIVSTLILTDGESDSVQVNCNFNHYGRSNTFVITDQKTKETYIMKDNPNQWRMRATDTFLKVLKSRTQTHLIGFYILNQSDIGSAASKYGNSLTNQENKKNWVTNGFATTTEYGYDEYHMINMTFVKTANSAKNDNLQISGNRSSMASEFASYINKRKVARVLLNRFIDRISKEAA